MKPVLIVTNFTKHAFYCAKEYKLTVILIIDEKISEKKNPFNL
jgi:hypothetical protein